MSLEEKEVGESGGEGDGVRKGWGKLGVVLGARRWWSEEQVYEVEEELGFVRGAGSKGDEVEDSRATQFACTEA